RRTGRPRTRDGRRRMTGSNQLASLLRADQRDRWGRGDRVRVEDYLEQHPGLHHDPDGLLDLIYNEIVLREEASDPPTLPEYLGRLGELEQHPRPLFEVHQALGAPRPVPAEAPPAGEAAAVAGSDLPAVPGYEILAEVGRGGMG